MSCVARWLRCQSFHSTADRAFLSSLHGNLSSSPSTSSPNQPSDKSSSCSRLLFKIPTKFVVKLRLSKRNIFPFNEFGIQLGGNLIKSSRRWTSATKNFPTKAKFSVQNRKNNDNNYHWWNFSVLFTEWKSERAAENVFNFGFHIVSHFADKMSFELLSAKGGRR